MVTGAAVTVTVTVWPWCGFLDLEALDDTSDADEEKTFDELVTRGETLEYV
jgi:hypothetical protein